MAKWHKIDYLIDAIEIIKISNWKNRNNVLAIKAQ